MCIGNSKPLELPMLIDQTRKTFHNKLPSIFYTAAAYAERGWFSHQAQRAPTFRQSTHAPRVYRAVTLERDHLHDFLHHQLAHGFFKF